MGKSKYPSNLRENSCIQSTVPMEAKTTNWNQCHTYVTNLMACPNKSHLQQREVHFPNFGSPPPKSHINPQWQDNASNANEYNNQMKSANDGSCNHAEMNSISNCLRDMRLKPVIVCENVDSDDDLVTELAQKNELLTLSVPPVDISDEKKRPPISDTGHQ